MSRTLYIDAAGDDASAEIGNPSRPYQTAQAAFDAAVAVAGNYLLKFGVGSFGSIVVPAGGWPSRIAISGCGYSVSRLTGINASGANGAAGSNHATTPTAGATGGDGKSISIRSDGSINLGAITASGGNGGTPGQFTGAATEATNGSTGVAGANGGNAGGVTLVNAVYDSITAIGGNGGSGGAGQVGGPGPLEVASGNGGDGGAGGNAGIRSEVVLHYCRCTASGGGDIDSTNGEIGTGGAGGDPGADGGGGVGTSGSPGGDGTTATGFTADLLLINSGVGAISTDTTEGEEAALNTCYVSFTLDGFTTTIPGDLGGNIETEVHKLP